MRRFTDTRVRLYISKRLRSEWRGSQEEAKPLSWLATIRCKQKDQDLGDLLHACQQEQTKIEAGHLVPSILNTGWNRRGLITSREIRLLTTLREAEGLWWKTLLIVCPGWSSKIPRSASILLARRGRKLGKENKLSRMSVVH